MCIKTNKERRFAQFTGTVIFIPVLLLLGMVASVPMGTLVAEPTGTVERGSKNDGTKAPDPFVPDGPCVINLTAPTENGHCDLGPSDDATKLKVIGWYDATGRLKLSREVNDKIANGKIKFLDRHANAILINPSPIRLLINNVPAQLNPAAGMTETWEHKTAWTKDEWEQADKLNVMWAAAWKRYRGNKFGTDKK